MVGGWMICIPKTIDSTVTHSVIGNVADVDVYICVCFSMYFNCVLFSLNTFSNTFSDIHVTMSKNSTEYLMDTIHACEHRKFLYYKKNIEW